ncbi:MAG: N-acetyl sugar amidotransferase [Methanobacteriota archaeon]
MTHKPLADGLVRCTRCVMPETLETIVFDEQGVCSVCRNQDIKQTKIDWSARKSDFAALIESYRGKHDYDCIVPFSGGKDSTFTLHHLVTEYDVKPLVVRFDHGFLRSKLHENTTRTLRKLGVDFLQFTPNWKVVQRLMLQAFLEKGDFCWHCHTGIFSYPMWVAIRYHVPLVVWGEPSSEYTTYYSYDQPEEVDEKRFNRYINLGINADDMLVRLEGLVSERDLKPFSYPPLRELRRINYRSVCLGSYLPWDVKRQAKLIEDELGWQGDEVEGVPPGYGYEKIECYMQGVRDYIKFIKRGYARPAHLASIDIRNGRMTHDEGLRVVQKNEGQRPPSLDLFLDFVGLTEDEFYEIARSHSISPYEHDRTTERPGERTHDFAAWPRHAPMDRKAAEVQLERFRRQQK